MAKADVLRARGVEQTQRVREVHTLADLQIVAAARSEHRRDEVPEAVDRQAGRLVERREEERGGHMGTVVLDVVNRGADPCRVAFELRGQDLPQVAHLAHVGQPILDRGERGPALQREQDLLVQMGRGIAPDRDVVDLGELQPGKIETETDRLGRESGPVLDAPDALFLDRRHQLAVDEQAGRRVAVVSVDAQDVQDISPRRRRTVGPAAAARSVPERQIFEISASIQPQIEGGDAPRPKKKENERFFAAARTA